MTHTGREGDGPLAFLIEVFRLIRRSSRGMIAVGAVALLATCILPSDVVEEGEEQLDSEATELGLLHDSVLTGTVGSPLVDPVAARVFDQYGDPMPGVTVQFTVETGAGLVSPALATTDANGDARAVWTLGPGAGTQSLIVSTGTASPTSTGGVASLSSSSNRSAGVESVPGNGNGPKRKVTANAMPGPVDTVTVSPASTSVNEGSGTQLSAEVEDEYENSIADAPVQWSSGNPTIAEVSADGWVTALNPGQTTIIAKSRGRTGAADIAVVATNCEETGTPGTVSDLTVTSTTESSAVLEFTEVDDGTCAPADYDVRFALHPIGFGWGSATTVSEGTCATVLEGAGIGVTRSCTILGLDAGTEYDFQMVAFRGPLNTDESVFGDLSNVATGTTAASGDTGPPASVTVSPSSARIREIDGTYQLSATAYDADGNKLTGVDFSWESLDPEVVTVNNTGLVTAKAVGTALVTVWATCCGSSSTTDAAAEMQVDTTTVGNGGSLSNVPSGWSLISNQPWDAEWEMNGGDYVRDGSGSWWQESGSGSFRIVSNQEDPVSAPSALEIEFPGGMATGNDPWSFWKSISGYQQLYVGFVMKLEDGWVKQENGQKIMHFNHGSASGFINWLTSCPGEAPGFTWRSNGPSQSPPMNDPCEKEGSDLALVPNVGSDPSIPIGEWFTIEFIFDLGSGSGDGSLQAFMNGEKYLDYSGLTWGGETSMDELHFSLTWGGGGSPVPSTQRLLIGHTLLATP